jgi:hypothetical protein
VFGLVFGRWWRLSVITAALGWPALLVATDVMGVGTGLLGASGIAMANTGVGVLIHQGILLVNRRRPKAQPTVTESTMDRSNS